MTSAADAVLRAASSKTDVVIAKGSVDKAHTAAGTAAEVRLKAHTEYIKAEQDDVEKAAKKAVISSKLKEIGARRKACDAQYLAAEGRRQVEVKRQEVRIRNRGYDDALAAGISLDTTDNAEAVTGAEDLDEDEQAKICRLAKIGADGVLNLTLDTDFAKYHSDPKFFEAALLNVFTKFSMTAKLKLGAIEADVGSWKGSIETGEATPAIKKRLSTPEGLPNSCSS